MVGMLIKINFTFKKFNFTFFSGDIKKSLKKQTNENASENDQLTGHFQSLFIFLFFSSPRRLI